MRPLLINLKDRRVRACPCIEYGIFLRLELLSPSF